MALHVEALHAAEIHVGRCVAYVDAALQTPAAVRVRARHDAREVVGRRNAKQTDLLFADERNRARRLEDRLAETERRAAVLVRQNAERVAGDEDLFDSARALRSIGRDFALCAGLRERDATTQRERDRESERAEPQVTHRFTPSPSVHAFILRKLLTLRRRDDSSSCLHNQTRRTVEYPTRPLEGRAERDLPATARHCGHERVAERVAGPRTKVALVEDVENVVFELPALHAPEEA